MATDPEHIANWQRLDGNVTTSGRLAPDDIDALAQIGVCHVINLALADSPGSLPDEAALLAARGIGYTHIPVPFDAPTGAHYAAFCAEFAAAARPVHVHCIMNWRVSAFFYRHHRAAGMDKAAARALMEQQWSPETSANPAAPDWAWFIAQGEQ
jgi:uncharacterized protein (TIGR01244 family)